MLERLASHFCTEGNVVRLGGASNILRAEREYRDPSFDNTIVEWHATQYARALSSLVRTHFCHYTNALRCRGEMAVRAEYDAEFLIEQFLPDHWMDSDNDDGDSEDTIGYVDGIPLSDTDNGVDSDETNGEEDGVQFDLVDPPEEKSVRTGELQVMAAELGLGAPGLRFSFPLDDNQALTRAIGDNFQHGTPFDFVNPPEEKKETKERTKRKPTASDRAAKRKKD